MNGLSRWIAGMAGLALALGAWTAGAADPAWPDSVARANAGQKRYDRWFCNYHESFVYKVFLKQKLKPEIKATLDQTLEIVRRVHAYSGGMHQVVYLVGWNYDGHDSCYPSWDKVGEQCRATWSDDPTTALRMLIAKARAYNADVSLHICANDAYENSPLWPTYVEKGLLCRNADGSLVKGQVFGGERSYPVCHAREWDAGYLQKRILALLDLVPELRGTHTIHVDALFGVESKYDKVSLADDVAAIDKMVDFWHDQGIDVTTEFLPDVGQIGKYPFFYHLNLDERLKTLCPPDVVCGGAGYNTRNTQNHYNKDWRGMMPLPGCVYEMAWGVAHWGDLTGQTLNDPRRMVERLFEKPILFAYYNRSRVVRHVEDTADYRVERANGSRLIMRTVRTVFTNLVLNGGTRLQSAGCYLFTTPHVIRGRMTVQGAAWDKTVDLTGNFGTNASGQQNRNAYRIEAEIAGDGWLNFGGGHPHANFSIVSANPAYKGRVSMGIGGSADLPIAIEFAEPTSFGGPLDAFRKDAVWLRSSYNGLRPRNSMVFDAANRGIYFEEVGAFIETPEGVEFTAANTITMKKGLRKCGAGTLALGAKIVPESADTDRRTLKIEAGFVKGTKPNAAEDLILDFAAGTGLAVDAVPADEAMKTEGLCMKRTDCFASTGAIPVRLDNAADLVARQARIVVALCTVPAGTPDLSSVFVCEKPGSRYSSKILKESLADGRVRYTASYSAKGVTIYVR